MEELINSNSPAEQVTVLNTILNKTNEAIQHVIESSTILNEKALQLRNHEIASATTGSLGHVKTSEDVVIDEMTKQIKVNRAIIDDKINEHSLNSNAHVDIRNALETIPRVITGVSVTGPGTVKSGVTNTFTISAIPLIPNSTITRIEVVLPDNSVLAMSGGNIVNNTATFDITLTGEDLSTKILKIRAIDNYGSKSEYYEHPVVISTNNPPNLDNLVVNGLSDIVKPNATLNISFTGGTDADGDTIKYSITNISDPTNISFSKTNNIDDGEVIQLTTTSAVTRNQVYNFTVVGTDNRFSGTASKVFSFKINTQPVATGITLNGLPTIVKPGMSYPVTITGGTDIDSSQTLKYSISSDKSYITFSKSTDISDNETFNIIYDSSATRGETPTFTITVSDGLETASKNITTGKVNSLPDASAITTTGLQTSVVGGTTYSFTITGSTDSDNQPITYKIIGGSGLNITPTVNIAPDANVTFNPTKVSTTTNITFTIYSVDSLGEQSATGKDFTVTVNPIIKTATPSIISPSSNAEIALPYTFQVSPYDTYIEL
jgi:hypothetical protein